jgi:phage terminase small subunit
MVKLTEKQKRFCDYYIQSPNATQAAIKAGYSKKTAKQVANENFTKPYLKEYISIRNKKLENERIAGIQEVKEFWTKVLREQVNDEVLIRDRLKASEYIAKTVGAFIDKVEHSGNIIQGGNLTIEIVKPDKTEFEEENAE